MIARGVRLGYALLLAMAGSSQALAAFPDKPIRLVIPFPPGGGTDLVGRALAEGMSKDLGQQIIVDNRSGAGTVIGTEHVATRPPDGYTILFISLPFATNPSLLKSLPYDTTKAFAPVVLIGRYPNVVVVPPERPYKTMQEFIAYAKANPGKLNYGSFGNGTSTHLGAEMLKVLAKIEMTHVPYKGGGPAIIDLLGGRLDVIFATAGSAGSHVRSGKLRAIAVTSATRSPAYPQLPTIAEAGVPGYEAIAWYGVMAPAGTPSEIIARLNASVTLAAQAENFRTRSAEDGLEISIEGPAALAKLLITEQARWQSVVREANIKPD